MVLQKNIKELWGTKSIMILLQKFDWIWQKQQGIFNHLDNIAVRSAVSYIMLYYFRFGLIPSFRTTVPIKKGEEILYNYDNDSLGKRQSKTPSQSGKHF